ncbi:esterase-like activity of phytase family protein, partial [Mobilicoccus pelagius]
MIARPLRLTAATFLAAATTGTTLLPAAATPSPAPAPASRATLAAYSVLPADTFPPGSETSGHFLTGDAAAKAPFTGQPVQGFSATHRLGDGSYLVMSDNGFGAKANSPDALLSVHRIRPGAAKDGKPGATSYLNTVFTLSDPHGYVPWRLWRDGGCEAAATLPKGYTCPTADRKLTGADFDIESMQVAPDGTFWFGEEFGPYLLHTDQQGRLLAPPVPTPGVKSPSNPTLTAGEKPAIPDSKGFEGMAISPDGRTLYPMLEGATAADKAAGHAADLRMFQVSLRKGGARFTGTSWRYRMESPDNAIGDMIAVDAHRFLVIERDSKQGNEAAFKRIYLADIRGIKPGGVVAKTLVADLMNLADPQKLSGDTTFTFPFFTIEDVELVDDHTIAVMNDNNYPATGGRGKGVADQNEYIEIRLPRSLHADPRLFGSFVPYGAARPSKAAQRLAVIGDVPYGEKQVAAFPGMIDDLNAAKPVAAMHLGDIKNGSTVCSDEYSSWVKSQFDRLRMPLVYTPGDNEWTDCHRTNNGGYNPLERLGKIRSTFFATPGVTNGRPAPIASQASRGFPENVSFRYPGVSAAAIHVVGSDNGRLPWTGEKEATSAQLAEEQARMAASIDLVEQTFATARAKKDRAVAIAMQADMFDPTYEPKPGTNQAFAPLVQKLVDETNDFDGRVYLLDGDSHVFHVDEPLAAGSRWLTFYGVKGAADDLTRITVDGSDNNTNWLEVRVDPR